MRMKDPTWFEGASRAWQKGLADAKLGLRDLSLIETHDCFTIAELMHYEAMGLAPRGEGARPAMDGSTRKGGALPIVLGGDHGITTPVLRGYADEGPITLVHVDAHLDWREDVNGVRDGLSSPIRRASEMAHVDKIVQIGLRMQGSARPADYQAARDYGAELITAYELHDIGMDAVLDRIPDGGKYYLSIDADGLDPTIMPAVDGPAPGGVTFVQARKLIHGLVKKGRVVGMDIVEIQPAKDLPCKLTCVTAGRLIVNLIGAAIRAGYFDKGRAGA